MRRASLLFLCLWLSAGAACSDDPNPSAPTPQAPNVTGTWAGSIMVQGTAAQMTWTLAQSGNNVSGPVLVRLASGIVLLNGTLSGTLNGSVLTYNVVIAPNGIPAQPTCSGQVGGTTMVSNDVRSLAGSFTVVSSTCPSPLTNGPITLTKQ